MIAVWRSHFWGVDMGVRRLGIAGVLVMLCGLLAACAPPGDTGSSAAVSAVLRIRAGEAQVDDGHGAKPAVDGQKLAAGDVVTSAGDGAIIELAWSDGSFTRLGPGTVFAVGAPGDPLGDRGLQKTGISWNRIADAATSGAKRAGAPYQIDVAAGDRVGDRGSLFVVDCRATPCRIVGTGGKGADGSKTSFRRGGVTTEVAAGAPAGWGALMADDWSVANARLDVAAGFAPVTDLFAGADPSRGLVDGTFSVLRTQTKWDCSGPECPQTRPDGVGEKRTLTFRFHTDCPDGAGACATKVDTQAVDVLSGGVDKSTVPLVTGASSFAWGTDVTRPICIWTYANGSQTPTGKTRNVIRWEVTPTKADVVDGVYRVTEMTGTSKADETTVERTGAQFPGCEALEYQFDSEADLVLTWTRNG